MAQGPSDAILVAIQITLQIRESKVLNPDPPDRRRFVLSEHSFLVLHFLALNFVLSVTFANTLALFCKCVNARLPNCLAAPCTGQACSSSKQGVPRAPLQQTASVNGSSQLRSTARPLFHAANTARAGFSWWEAWGPATGVILV